MKRGRPVKKPALHPSDEQVWNDVSGGVATFWGSPVEFKLPPMKWLCRLAIIGSSKQNAFVPTP
jgi:hypothetical protein